MKILKVLFPSILLFVAFALFIPHLFFNYWFTDIFSHFNLQYSILLLVLLLPASLFLIKKKIIPVMLILIVFINKSYPYQMS